MGLTTGKDAPLEVAEGGIAGRGVFATGEIHKGSWLCEYKGIVYPLKDKHIHEAEYIKNSEGCYVVTSQHPVGGTTRLCWDATRRYHQLGRYLNHALRSNATLTSPVYARGKWRVGFVATMTISSGDEVVWDYGVRDEEWATTLLKDGILTTNTVRIVCGQNYCDQLYCISVFQVTTEASQVEQEVSHSPIQAVDMSPSHIPSQDRPAGPSQVRL